MRKTILIFGLLSVIACSDKKNSDTGSIENTIEKVVSPKLFAEGEWVTKGGKELFPDIYKKPTHEISVKNDSILVVKMNIYIGKDNFKNLEKEASIISVTNNKIETSNIKNENIRYIIEKNSDGIKIITKSKNNIIRRENYVPF